MKYYYDPAERSGQIHGDEEQMVKPDSYRRSGLVDHHTKTYRVEQLELYSSSRAVIGFD